MDEARTCEARTHLEGDEMNHPSSRLAILRSLVIAMLTWASVALAQDLYQDARGYFDVPVPVGWSNASTPDHAAFVHEDPEAAIYVVAAPGEEDQVALAALQVLIDAGLEESFLATPLQAAPVALPSGVWTQRIYHHGDGDLIAVVSLEQAGVTYLLLAKGSQAAFTEVVNAAVNPMLLGIALAAQEEDVDEELPYFAEDVTFDRQGLAFSGTLTLPAGEGPHPAIILISGSGAQDRDGAHPSLAGYRPFRWLADHLTREGIAVLRFDERGTGASEGDHDAATSADFALDNEAALDFLRDRADIDAAQVGLLGHSEGGLIAAMIAARNPDVAFVVSMAGPALPYSDVVVKQTERILEATGASDEAVAAAVARQRTLVDLAVAEAWDEMDALLVDLMLEQLGALPEDQRAGIGDLEAFARAQAATQVDAFRNPWMHFFLTYDPAQDWAQITVPVLALFGALDTQVDVAQNQRVMEAALADAGTTDVTTEVFPTANHLFQEAVTGGPDEYLSLEMQFAPGVMEAISAWLRERVDVIEPIRREDVTFDSGGPSLAGTLTLPSGEGPHPAVVLIHGTGPHTRAQDLHGFEMLTAMAERLAHDGVASLRYDKRGVAESTGDYDAATSADLADDAEAAMRFLMGHPAVDAARVGLLGHSEGGMIAPMIAARNRDVAFVISMAGPAAPPLEGLMRQHEKSLQAAGAPEPVIEREMAQLRTILELTLAEDWEALEALFREVIGEQLATMTEAQREGLGGIDALIEQVMPQYRVWYRYFLQHDTAADWQRVTVPVLVLFGGLDSLTDVEEHRPALATALEGHGDVTVRVFPTANHLFQDAVTGSELEYATLAPEFAPGVLEAITDWLQERTRHDRP